jgi:phage repressor protein C with HTH and peptisase S24 domain
VRDRQAAARDYVQGVLDSCRWTPTELARKIDVRPSTVTRFLSDKDLSHSLKLENLMKISEAARIPLSPDVVVAYGVGTRPIVTATQDARDDRDEDSNVSDAPYLNRDSHRKLSDDIPVYGTVQGGADGAFELNTGEAIDWVRRPLALEGKVGLYALYVEGSSMSPRFYPGERILVNGKKPPAIGDDVVVQVKPKREGDPIRAYLKSLVRRNSEEIEVEQFNPPKKRTFKAAEILSVHVVLRRDEIF